MPNTRNYREFLDIDHIQVKSSLADTHGLPFTDRFVCLLNGPKDNGIFEDRNEFLEFQVMSAEVPNFSIDPVELELNGARRFVFKGRTDSELSITFLETPDMKLRRYFYYWMNKAISISNGGSAKDGYTGGVRRGYMNEYMPVPSTFYIFPLDNKGDSLYADQFMHIFPYDISGVSYNYEQSGEILKTTVKFKYMYHHMIDLVTNEEVHLSELGDDYNNSIVQN